MVIIPLLINYFQRNSQKRVLKNTAVKMKVMNIFANVIIHTILNKKIDH